jgi:hypothetical protein
MEAKDVLLEEIEDIGSEWLVTLGMVRLQSNAISMLGRTARAFKIFTVDKLTKKVTKMKIRELLDAI